MENIIPKLTEFFTKSKIEFDLTEKTKEQSVHIKDVIQFEQLKQLARIADVLEKLVNKDGSINATVQASVEMA